MWRSGHLAGGQAVLHCKGEFVHNFGGMWCDDGRTQNDTFFVGDDLHEAVMEITRITAGDDSEWGSCFVDWQVALQAIIFAQPD